MSIAWLCIPSKRTDGGTIRLWRERGYGTAIWRDVGDPSVECDLMLTGEYRGYPAAVNALIREVLTRDKEAQWFIAAGDDMEPDANDPAKIAVECGLHFAFSKGNWKDSFSFGVMQPTGDRWGEDHPPHDGTAYADRVCGSPWLGREFCERVYGGNGPLFEGYTHMFADEELFNVTSELGVLWQRRDLIHLHRHWGRREGQYGSPADMPEFLREVNSPGHWERSKGLFESRKAAGFPGHEPLPLEVAA